jgi:hypothetical protein
LLQALSVGTSYHEAHASSFFNREKSKTPEWEERVREEKAWVRAIHEQLLAAIPKVVEALRRGREKERIAAASLLATLQDNPAATEALAAACTDGHPGLAVVALTAIGRLPNPPAGVLERCFEEAPDDVVRTAAAIHILSHRERETPAAVVEHLLNHLRNPKEDVRKAYEELPDVGAFLGDVGDALARGPRKTAEEAFPMLYEQVKASPYDLNYSQNFGVLSLAVGMDPPSEGRWTPGRLTQPQRLAIRLVADRAWRVERGVPTTSCNIVDLLERVGLPGKRAEVFELLAGTPEGVQTPKEEANWSGKRKRPWWKFF